MRRGGACLLVLACLCLGGCLSGEPTRSSSGFSPNHAPRTNLGPDGVLLELALIERPLGDPFLNDEIWSSADCQVVDLEKKGFLEDNGFRIGQIVGMNPAKLQTLLDSERHFIPIRKQILPAGTETSVP